MQTCDMLEPMELQEIDNENRRFVVYDVEPLSMGQVLQLSADNDGIDALTFEVVNVEQNDLEGDPTPMESELEDISFSSFLDHEFIQDMFKECSNIELTETINEVFTLNDNNNDNIIITSTSVPHSEHIQYTCGTSQQCYCSACQLEKHNCLCSDVWRKDLSRENSTSSHTHTGQRPYQCRVCKKSFSLKKSLKRHRRTHTGKKPYQCHVCRKLYSQKSYLSKHMRTHTSEKPYLCDICKKQFSQKLYLTNHMRTHTGEKPYHCNVCNTSFSLMNHLTNHMLKHTGEKPYQCSTCERVFSLKKDYKRHMRTHTGEKPHQCHVCEQLFSQKYTLSKHMRIHTGEKPYLCEICKKQFSQKAYLSSHMRTHTGEKPHECNICKKCFSVRNSLTKHIIRTHTSNM